MAEMEAEHGGLVKAMLAKQRARGAAKRELAQRRARGEDTPQMAEMERPGGPVGPAGRLTSFRGGIQTFTDALATALGPAVEHGRPLAGLRPIDGREGSTRLWRLDFAGGELLEADEVVLAIPAAQAAPLVAPLDEVLASTLRAIPSAGLAVVALAYDAATFQPRALGQGAAGAPDGFGFLVPRGEGPRILGALWDSSVFPGERAPAGKVLLRVMIGGALDPEAVGLPEEELLAIARTDLARTMGLDAATAPERHWIFRHRVGISQYTVGHAARLAAIATRLATLPGLHIAGQSYFGVSMNGCCEQAARFAEQRIAGLSAPTGATA
jgi:oxygen-dependent protoporphyrinogen oxidase